MTPSAWARFGPLMAISNSSLAVASSTFLWIWFQQKMFWGLLSKFNPQKIFCQNFILEIFTEKVSCHTNIHRRCSFKIIPLFWKNIFCGYCNDRKLSLWIFWGYYFDTKFSVRYWKNIKYKDIFSRGDPTLYLTMSGDVTFIHSFIPSFLHSFIHSFLQQGKMHKKHTDGWQ